MTTNKQIVINWLNGSNPTKTKHLFYEGDIIYSYGYHFPICIKFNDGFLFNQDRYSNTTARHKGLVKREINKEVIQVSTRVLKEIILNNNLKSLKEFKDSSFFNSL